MELRRYAHLLRRRLLLVVAALAVGLAAGYLVSDRTPTYRAQASIYVGSRQFSAIADSTVAAAAMDRLTLTFAAMVKSDPVAVAAIELANAPRTASQVLAATVAVPVPNANYISVYVSDTDPAIAQSLANGMVQSFVAQVQNLEPTTSAGTPPVASMFQRAVRPGSPLPSSTRRNVVLGGLFGLAAGFGTVVLVNYLDISVKTSEDVERYAGLPVLGTIPVLSPAATSARRRTAQPGPASPPGPPPSATPDPAPTATPDPAPTATPDPAPTATPDPAPSNGPAGPGSQQLSPAE